MSGSFSIENKRLNKRTYAVISESQILSLAYEFTYRRNHASKEIDRENKILKNPVLNLAIYLI